MTPGRVPRREFLTGALGVGAGGAAGVAAGMFADRAAADRSDGRVPSRVPFHGAHQAGIVTPSPAHAALVSFDVQVATRSELTDLLRTLTERARWLTSGGTPPDPGITAPPNDSGVLGPDVPADRLTVTIGVGASLFDDRYGLAPRRPAQLRAMRTFANDDLDPALCHGDLSVQICADHADAVIHALRDLARHTRGGMQIRWRRHGYLAPPRPDGTPRNLMGFKDGTANPDTTDRELMNRLVWCRPRTGLPDWAAGGSYQVIRLIRMRLEFWDRVSVSEQENIFGRRRDTGAPLDGTHESDQPHYARDPIGAAIPLTSHIRRANPRTRQSADSRLVRRSFNYDNGVDAVGDLDMGLIFICYQADLEGQFETVQKRLADEPLVDYITPQGGGYFLVLPGLRDADDYYGRALLSDA